jgi:hypothetical protein
MGLDYRSYSLVLMDRGTAPSALVFDLGGALIASADGRTLFDEQGRIVPRPNVVEKLEAIGGCSILVVAGEPDAAAAIEQLALLAGATITGFRTYGPGRRDETIAALASEHAINPSSCVLICERPPETGLLGGFVPTADYFR